MPKMEHKINYFNFQPSVQSVELFNLWSMHPYLVSLTFPSTISFQITNSLLHSIVEQWLQVVYFSGHFWEDS